MSTTHELLLIRMAGMIYAGIVFANAFLPGKLRVRQSLANVPRFLRQVVYVHWFYIVLIVGFFGALCFGYPYELMGQSALGRFLSTFMAGFWLLRLLLQLLYYDAELRRQIWALDALYNVLTAGLVALFGFAALFPVA